MSLLCLSPLNMVVFGDGALWEVIRVKQGHEGVILIMELVPLQEETQESFLSLLSIQRGHMSTQ